MQRRESNKATAVAFSKKRDSAPNEETLSVLAAPVLERLPAGALFYPVDFSCFLILSMSD